MPRRLSTLLMTLLVIGCGDKTGDVSGIVSYRDEPLPGGYITFLTEGKNPKMISSPIGSDGSYSVNALPIGRARVTVQGIRARAAETPDPTQFDPAKARKSRDPVFVPYYYADADTSGLTYEVRPGKQDKDFELRDKPPNTPGRPMS